MKQRYLEVTFRNGKPFAAYLHLPHEAGKPVARTRDAGHGIKIDLDERGKAIGVEITAPVAVTIGVVNVVLVKYGVPVLDKDEWAPLAA